MNYFLALAFSFLITHQLFSQEKSDLQLIQTDTAFAIHFHGKNLLSYRTAVKLPPAGIDPVYGRAGFVHPLSTLNGHVLTRIQPADHYHHYGLWNPWTRMEYNGKVYDLWNLGDKQGTVRHTQIDNQFSNKNKAGFSAQLEHVAFTPDEGEVVLLKENWKLGVEILDDKHYQLDLISILKDPNQESVTLKAYRYAGLGLRATEQWNNENSRVLTSSGKSRKDADGSLERWFLVEGTVDGEQAGILFLSSPKNFNHPEPVRVWPEADKNVFVNYSPTKTKDWVLKPNQENTLKYRLIVYDGTMDKEQAESYWARFADQNK